MALHLTGTPGLRAHAHERQSILSDFHEYIARFKAAKSASVELDARLKTGSRRQIERSRELLALPIHRAPVI